MSKIQRMRAVLTGVVATALAVATLPVLATTASAASADPLGGQAGASDPVTHHGPGPGSAQPSGRHFG